MHDHKQGAESLVEVTKADRDAAEQFAGPLREWRLGQSSLADVLPEAFARHRITATSEASLSVERMREALEQIAGNNWRDQTRARHVARVALNTTAEGGER